MTRSAVALIRLVTPPAAQTPDAELLRSFVASQTNEDAFAELVRRHGPMVLAVCRRVLYDTHDAEDAFQAVFLVLARRAGAIRGTNLAGWLYGVAVRTARGVRIMRDRQRKRFARGQGTGDRGQESNASPPETSLVVTEQAAIIDEELAKLPEHYRDAIIVCELRGLSRKDAARELGIPEGTLSSRLAAAKRKLASLLAARGITGAVVLAAVLAPATVSAALEQSTAFAIRGAATTSANAVASTILKGMLFDQLKRVVLTGGLLLTAVCGGLAMTGSPDSPTTNSHAVVSQPAVDEVAGFVNQLGSDDYAEREDAGKKLRERGLKAEAAIKVGLNSENPEVRARSARLLGEIRKDALDALAKGFNPDGADEPDHPIWKRYKALAGNDVTARRLFAEIIRNPRRRQLLDLVEANPDKARELYERQIVEMDENFEKGLERQTLVHRYCVRPLFATPERISLAWDEVFIGDVNDPPIRISYRRVIPYEQAMRCVGSLTEEKPLPPGALTGVVSYGGSRIIDPQDPTPKPADVAVAFYLGTFPVKVGLAPVSYENHLFGLLGFHEGLDDPYPKSPTVTVAPAFRRLFANWVAGHRNFDSICCGLSHGRKVPEMLPVARAILSDAKSPRRLQFEALPVILAFGEVKDESLVKPFLADTTVIDEYKYGSAAKERQAKTQVRDLALVTLLALRGKHAGDFDFPGIYEFSRSKPPRQLAFSRQYIGFYDDASRDAVHAKAKEWLDKKSR